MDKLVKFFIDNHKLTIILSFIVIAFGFLGFSKLNSESFPSVNFATAIIETRYDGATAEDIETKITKKLEDAIRKVSGLKDVKSVSKSGLSSIVVRVDMDNEDEEQVLEDLQKEINSVSDLPADLRDDPSYLEVNSAEFPAIEVAIVGDNNNRKRDLLVDLLKEELEDNKRVKAVRPSGFLKRQFNIRLDYKKMEKFYIGLDEVTRMIYLRNIDIPGGEIISNGVKNIIRIEGKVKNTQDVSNIVIRSNFNGQRVQLKDIADVYDAEEDVKFLSSFNGEPATFLVVTKKAGADTIKLVDDVNIILEKFSKQYKDQFKIQIYNNESDKVKKKLDILSSNAVSGLLLVVVFLFIFLPGKVGLMASLSLPLAVLATIGFMPSFGMNLDAITILALVIALGMLVDNAVVISENFSRLRIEENLDNRSAAIKSVKQLWLPITTTGLTTIAAFLPMLVTKGIMGQFIKYIPIVVTIAILISLVESFFLLPMRLRFSGRSSVGESSEKKIDWFDRFTKKFENFMAICIRRRYFVAIGFVLTLIGSMLLMTKGNKFELFPAEQTEVYTARVEMPRGTTAKATLNELDLISKDIISIMGDWQRAVVTRSGTSSMGSTDPKGSIGENQGLITIYASDYAKYNVNFKDFLKKIRAVESKNATKLTFKELINGPPVGSPINVTLRSNNNKSLKEMSAEIVKQMSAIDGVEDVETNDILGEKEIKVKIDYDKAAKLGLTVSSVGNAVRTALSGSMVSKVTLDNKEIDLNVKYSNGYRSSIEDLKSIKIMDNQGNLVPLSSVATVIETNGQYEIKRFDFKRSKTITGNVDGVKMNSIKANSELTKIFNKLSSKYNDVNLVYGGEEEATKESMQSLGQALLLSLMGIFGLLVFLFKSYLRPFIIMTTIPLGLIGFSIAFFFHDKAISFMAMIGVIGLGGIIVNSGIVLIAFIDEMRAEGKLSLDEALAKASGIRLKAVFVTSLTTISGLIPTAYGIGGSDSMLVPMTMAMAWGLTSGTILTLVWVPCAYAILEDFNNFLSKVPFLRKFVGGEVHVVKA